MSSGESPGPIQRFGNLFFPGVVLVIVAAVAFEGLGITNQGLLRTVGSMAVIWVVATVGVFGVTEMVRDV